MNQSGIAAVLSFLIPGLGQIYNGDFLRAIFLFCCIRDRVAGHVGDVRLGLPSGGCIYRVPSWCAIHAGRNYKVNSTQTRIHQFLATQDWHCERGEATSSAPKIEMASRTGILPIISE
jgi:hypothetical protein